MRKIELENINFWGDNWNSILEIPDDMVFVEVYRYKSDDGKDPQRFYAGFYPYSKEVYKSMKEGARVSIYNILDTWIYIELHNVNPVNEDLPLIDFDEFNKRYMPWFSQYVVEYVGPKMLKEEDIKNIDENIEDFLFNPKKLIGKDIWYTITMSKLLRFTGKSEHLQVEVANVGFNSWLTEKDEVKMFAIVYHDFKTFLSDDYVIKGKYFFKKDEESWNKYKNRIKEFLNYSDIEL